MTMHTVSRHLTTNKKVIVSPRVPDIYIHMYTYIYIYIYVCVYVYLIINIYTHIMKYYELWVSPMENLYYPYKC